MPTDTRINAPAGEATLLASSDISSAFVQNLSSHDVWIIGTAAGSGAPIDHTAGLCLSAGSVILNEALTDLFPGVPSVARLWAFPVTGAVDLKVSHA